MLPLPPADAATTTAELEALRAQLLDHLLPHLRGYIWQRDRFALQPSTLRQAPWQRRGGGGARRRREGSEAAAAAAAVPHLWGSLSFGDNLEDEWFVVWLLLELTRAFPVTARCALAADSPVVMAPPRGGVPPPLLTLTPLLRSLPAVARWRPTTHPGARPVLPCPPTRRAWDNDGEFLLIEAAYGLPRWLKPETAQNRLWLHAGGVRLVPLPRFAGGCTGRAWRVELGRGCTGGWMQRVLVVHPSAAAAPTRFGAADPLCPPQATHCWRPPLAWPRPWRRCVAARSTRRRRPSWRPRWRRAWRATPPAPRSRCTWLTRCCRRAWRGCWALSRSWWRRRWRRSTTETPMTSRWAASGQRALCAAGAPGWQAGAGSWALVTTATAAAADVPPSCMLQMSHAPAPLPPRPPYIPNPNRQAAARMAAFPPADLVLAAPRLSRCLYAQLALQQYAPPRGWPMPMPTDPQVGGWGWVGGGRA